VHALAAQEFARHVAFARMRHLSSYKQQYNPQPLITSLQRGR
jgi:hypothetical protein